MFRLIFCGLCCERQNQKAAHRNVRLGSSRGRQTSASSLRSSTKSFAENISAALLPSSFADDSLKNQAEDESKNIRKHLKELRSIARRLEGPVQKHPKSGKSLMKKMQDRYIACIPNQEGGKDTRDEHAEEIEKWKTGQLAYWETANAYKQGTPPKGHVMLLKIAKVWVSKDDARGKSVVVKHKLNNEMQEMTLVFPTKRDAEEWSYALWEFISKLRDQANPIVGGASSSASI